MTFVCATQEAQASVQRANDLRVLAENEKAALETQLAAALAEVERLRPKVIVGDGKKSVPANHVFVEIHKLLGNRVWLFSSEHLTSDRATYIDMGQVPDFTKTTESNGGGA